MSDETSLHPWDSRTLRELRDATGLTEIEFHEEIGSTNTRALERLRHADWMSPALILAHQQTQGRGRGSNRWWSAHGGLTLSLMVEPRDLSEQALAPLTLRAGLGAAKAVDRVLKGDLSKPSMTAPRTQLKWPNDLLLDGRKVAGLLVERVADRPGIVVGIGLNVNQAFDEAPDEIRARATSLFEHDGQTRDLPLVLRELIRGLLEQLVHETDPSAGSSGWVEEFRQRCALTGKVVEVGHGSQRSVGRCEGIDAGGRLVLVSEQGRTAVNSGSILGVSD